VGTLDRFNNGKRAEERDRVKHGIASVHDVASVDVEGLVDGKGDGRAKDRVVDAG
jgi:hypothetical protein